MANGVRFAVLSEGKGPLVLLLHGFPDTPHTWDAVRPALASAGFRAVSPFMRGYAPTTVPDDGRYDCEALGRDVVGLIEVLGQGPALVVGHDWGAAAAFAAVALAPHAVKRLVTITMPHPASIRLSPRIVWGSRHFVAFRSRQAERRVAANDFAAVDELVRRWSPAWNPSLAETAPVKECFRQPRSLSAALGYYRAVGLRAPRFMRRPTTVASVAFSGADDPVLRLADFERARRFHRAPHEIVHMPGGHFLHRERFIRELVARVCSP